MGGVERLVWGGEAGETPDLRCSGRWQQLEGVTLLFWDVRLFWSRAYTMSKANTLFRPLVVRMTEGSEDGEGSFGGLEVLPAGLLERKGCGFKRPEVSIGAVFGLK